MKKVNNFLPFLFLLSILFLTGCSKDDGPSPAIPQSIVQFVNAYTNTDAVFITNDYGTIVTPDYRPLFFRNFTIPVLFYPGNRTINVINFSNEKLVSQTTIGLKDSTYYTSFVYGNTEKANNLFVVNAPIKDLDKSKSASRFMHLASNLGPVNVYLNNTETPLFTNRSAETTSGLSEAPHTFFTAQTAGKFDIIVTNASNEEILKKEHVFEPNHYYSLILVGDKDSESKGLYLGVVKH